ncbi:lipoate--protein ligase family protein [Isobaculum melis]|uniref:Octanoyl-[GcvH]:protein N-octanoyltransferase n=1 Tax=Isobaculum melis TaxID=142588 RepID=A0A1H9U295_9LACT|nr:lipoate--protein ligase family protein [Isobaculum melis]SES03625.1 octanoyl-[GcvH]:protein N-octanoyltransferase [Isobaculum melis]
MSQVPETTNHLQQTFAIFNDVADVLPNAQQTPAVFALGDSLTEQVGKELLPGVVHFWQKKALLILGMIDTKLPYFDEALLELTNQQYPFLVRNAGGLAVVADEGVLNFSLILSETAGKISIPQGYQYMLQIIQEAFADFHLPIEAYEIVDSYCPGDYDLSIHGKKFAGIAQRRLKNGVGVMIYLSVNGSQAQRVALVQDFYQAGKKDAVTKWHYPNVSNEVMASLDELLGVSLTIEEVETRILKAMKKLGATFQNGQYNQEIVASYEAAYQKMIKRNQQSLGAYFFEGGTSNGANSLS